MAYPIKLNTAHGQSRFDYFNKEFLDVRKIGGDSKREFHEKCERNYNLAIKEIDKFLNDDDSIKSYKLSEEDVEGFVIYNELHDTCSILNYFRNKLL